MGGLGSACGRETYLDGGLAVCGDDFGDAWRFDIAEDWGEDVDGGVGSLVGSGPLGQAYGVLICQDSSVSEDQAVLVFVFSQRANHGGQCLHT